MKAIYSLIFLLALVSISQCGVLDFIGSYISVVLRADILDIIDCVLHNEIIIKDVNKIIDPLLKGDISAAIGLIASVASEIIAEFNKCKGNPTFKF